MDGQKQITLGIDCDDTLWQLDHHYRKVKYEIIDYIDQLDHNQKQDKETLYHQLESHMGNRIKHQGVGYIMIERAAIDVIVELKGFVTKTDLEFLHAKIHTLANLDLPPYDGVPETLNLLKDKYRLLALTKGHPGEQRPKFMKSPLAQFFDGLEIMYDKDVTHYRDVIKKYHINLDHFVMIGNSLKSDILPVIELGGQAIHIPCPHFDWIHETVTEEDQESKKYTTLEKFSDLPEYLENCF